MAIRARPSRRALAPSARVRGGERFLERRASRAEFDAEGPNGVEAAIAAPDGSAVLLAESQPTMTGDRVRLTRVDCP